MRGKEAVVWVLLVWIAFVSAVDLKLFLDYRPVETELNPVLRAAAVTYGFNAAAATKAFTTAMVLGVLLRMNTCARRPSSCHTGFIVLLAVTLFQTALLAFLFLA